MEMQDNIKYRRFSSTLSALFSRAARHGDLKVLKAIQYFFE
jgi:hypothetical protein